MNTTVSARATQGSVQLRTAPAIRLIGVSKSYRLYDRPHERLMDQIGLNRLMFWKKNAAGYHLFHALENVNLTIEKGERVGIIGRNGAGKTTMLKLITENFAPSEGIVEVDGSVQALMQLGIGFHPEFSGQENIRAALHYNGLTGAAFKEALEDVIDFVELGEFLHQPLKTYSLGMNARLQFAAATAIRPDILIIDEVMGAGDAYFTAKSSQRVRKLTERDCTLLLVSHSTPQVLQFCSRAIWLEQGRIAMDGPAQEVVGAYEVFSEQRLRAAQESETSRPVAPTYTPLPRRADNDWIGANIAAKESLLGAGERPAMSDEHAAPSEDESAATAAIPVQAAAASAPAQEASSSGSDGGPAEPQQFKVTLENGMEAFRWPGKTGLKYLAVALRNNSDEEGNVIFTHRRCTIRCKVLKEVEEPIRSRIFITAFNLEALRMMWVTSPMTDFNGGAGDRYVIDVVLDPLLLGGGTYLLSVSLFETEDLRILSAEQRYDLLSRCLEFKVVEFDARQSPVFHHPGTWYVQTITDTGRGSAADPETSLSEE